MDGTRVDYKQQTMTMMDLATGQFKIVETHTKTAEHIGKLLDRTWFSRYSRPQCCVFDNGNEFLREKSKEMIESYHLMDIPTMVKKSISKFSRTCTSDIKQYDSSA